MIINRKSIISISIFIIIVFSFAAKFLLKPTNLNMRADEAVPVNAITADITNYARVFTLDDSGKSTNINALTTFPRARFIKGIVKDKTYIGIPNVTVELCKFAQSDFTGDCVQAAVDHITDSLGQYEYLDSLSPGAYLLTFTPSTQDLMPDQHYLTIDVLSRITYDIILREKPVINLQINFNDSWLKPSSSPPGLEAVKCDIKDRSGATRLTDTSDIDGKIRFYDSMLVGGKYSVECNKTNFQNITDPNSLIFIYSAGVYINRTILMDYVYQKFQLSVTVKDSNNELLQDVTLNLLLDNGSGKTKDYTIPSGNYIINDLPSGLFQATFSKEGYDSQSKTFQVDTINPSPIINVTLSEAAIE